MNQNLIGQELFSFSQVFFFSYKNSVQQPRHKKGAQIVIPPLELHSFCFVSVLSLHLALQLGIVKFIYLEWFY